MRKAKCFGCAKDPLRANVSSGCDYGRHGSSKCIDKISSLPAPIRRLCNAAGAATVGDHYEGIPDTLSVPVSGLRVPRRAGSAGPAADTPWLPLFRQAPLVYVALDRDATDRAIALARMFGTRERVLPRRTSGRRAISTTGCG